jgi:serine/threonine protein kinase
MALAAGLRLGPYEILNGIGAGGMGEVYRAKDTRLDRLVAIKVLPSHLTADPETRQRLGPPQQLFQIDTSVAGENYFVTRDGKRFLVDRKSGTEAPLTVVLNWPSLLARK